MTAPDWLFDLGNTRLKCAPVDARDGEVRVGDVQAHAHDGERLADRWLAGLPARIDTAWVSSVASAALHAALLDALAARCARIQLARTQARFAGVRIAYAQPRRLGVDRFLALLAARARDPRATLVVGVGTALTIDLLDDRGTHRGGRIAPSPALMREVLHARAPQLPRAGGAPVDFATTTEDALASGCEGAALALVRDSIDAAATQLAEPPGVLLHGGGAAALAPRLPRATQAPALVLEGLLQWRRAAAPLPAAG